MKKYSILFIILFAAQYITAQSSKYKIAFRVNPNISWAKAEINSMKEDGSVLRLGFGMMFDKMFSDNYAFGTGLDINRLGGKLIYKSTGKVDGMDRIWETSRNYSIQYIEIPLTLKLRTNEIGYITYWGQFGVGLGLNIRAKADEELDYLFDRNVQEGGGIKWEENKNLANLVRENLDIKDDIKLFRTALIMALGVEYNLSGSTSIIAGVTFNNGFSNFLSGRGVQVNDKGAIDYSTNAWPTTYKLKAINNCLALNVGVLF